MAILRQECKRTTIRENAGTERQQVSVLPHCHLPCVLPHWYPPALSSSRISVPLFFSLGALPLSRFFRWFFPRILALSSFRTPVPRVVLSHSRSVLSYPRHSHPHYPRILVIPPNPLYPLTLVFLVLLPSSRPHILAFCILPLSHC